MNFFCKDGRKTPSNPKNKSVCQSPFFLHHGASQNYTQDSTMSSSSSSSSFSIPTATTIHNLYQSHCPQSVRNVVQLGTDEVKTCWYQMQHGSLATSVTATAAAAAVAASKGNDGRSPYQRRRRICRWILVVLFLFVGYRLLVVHFLAGLVPDIEIDPTTGRKRIRRRPERTKKVDEHGNVVPR